MKGDEQATGGDERYALNGNVRGQGIDNKEHVVPNATGRSRPKPIAPPLPLRRFAERYDQSPVIQALIRVALIGVDLAVPAVGSVAAIALDTTIKNIVSRRGQAYFDELAKGDFVARAGLLENEDFVHCFSATTTRALNTYRLEKVRMFARLLKTPMSAVGGIASVNEYEYFLSILDDLNFREILALRILDEFSGSDRKSGQNDAQWTMTFWDDFHQQVSKKLNIPLDEVGDFMVRISRTACYHEFKGYYDVTGGMGMLSPTFGRLKEFIKDREEQTDNE